MLLFGLVFSLFLTALLFLLRVYFLLNSGSNHPPKTRSHVAVLVVAGSGGHTTEIMRLMESLSAAYTPRHYVIADTDKMSEEKIVAFESSKPQSHTDVQTVFMMGLLSNLIDSAKQLFLSLAVPQRMLQTLLPDGNQMNRPWRGWVESERIWFALATQRLCAMFWIGRSGVPMKLSAVFTCLRRDFQSEALRLPDQMEILLVSRLSMVPL
ncbi:UDP-N-acetylglucosamine transferase subunit ALG14 isoform X2 [Xiphophorus hellerii]|uniref:UDP-N-acetylglucosamine transferase subunit ALG14 isoform X2 n=1 Tax=Xiphophorus hellerii TaxID=8084 RepID=UPI0013B35D66|nr:UDP-N-acetylglucosamine transferase subunit ALG14 homolog isoform X2 [Xiphophorus hellerii]